MQQTVAHCMGQSSLMAPGRIEAPPRALCSDMVLISLHHHFTQGHSLEALPPPHLPIPFKPLGRLGQEIFHNTLCTDQDPPKKKSFTTARIPLCQRKCLLGWNVFFCFVYALLEWSVFMGQNGHQICSRMDDSEESHATRLKYCPHWLELPTWLFPCFMGRGGQ